MKLTDKIAYLQGLMDGLNFDCTTKEGKILVQMVDILREVVLTVTDIQDEVGELTELCDIIDEDLGEVEDVIFDDCESDDCCDDDCCCDDYDDFDEDELYEVTCPSCKDTICINEDMLLDGSMDCPNCGELLEFDFDEDDTDEGNAE